MGCWSTPLCHPELVSGSQNEAIHKPRPRSCSSLHSHNSDPAANGYADANRVTQLVPRWFPLFRKGWGKYASQDETNSSHLTVNCSQTSTHPNLPSQGRGTRAPQDVTTFQPFNFSTFKLRKRTAFTLAEVLITLAIIGIVAALTIPTLVQSYKKKVYSARLKKFYSVMSQAIALSEVENGPKNTWDKASMSANYNPDGTFNEEFTRTNCYNFFIRYLAPYIRYSKETIKKNRTFYLPDGSSVWMHNGEYIDLLFDLNGSQGPNTSGVDIFRFYISLRHKETIIIRGYGLSREELIEKCKVSYPYCTGLLQTDNWEFKDDYPFKL